MGEKILIYSGSSGLNNKYNHHRLSHNEAGIVSLEDSINVLISNSAELCSRGGTALAFPGDFHSFYSVDEYAYVVKNNANGTANLYQLLVNTNDKSIELLNTNAELTRNAFVDFTRNGDDVYYGNGYDYGVLDKDVASSWPVSLWQGPTTTVTMLDIPAMDHLAYMSEKIFFSLDNVLYQTEVGLYGIYSPALNHKKFATKIRMLVPVDDGLYVATERRIHFFSSLDPMRGDQKVALSHAAYEWAWDKKVYDTSLFGIDIIAEAPIIGTSIGPVMLLPNGKIISLIDKNVKLPSCVSNNGCLTVVDETIILQGIY